MNHIKKSIIIFLSFLFVVSGILSVFPSKAFAQGQGGNEISVSLEEINQGLETPGVLRVGMEANYAPFNWSQTSATNDAVPIANSQGEYANGYDVQMSQRIADLLGLELEIIKLDWDGLPPALESGRIDAIIAGMSATPERLEQIDFSEDYYESSVVLVVREDSEYTDATSLEDFSGSRVTGQQNTFHYDLIEQIPNVDQQTAMQDFPGMIQSVLSGKSDAYVSEEPGAMAATMANDSLTYVEFEEGQGFTLGEYSAGVAVGLRQNSPLTPAVNQALSQIPIEERDQLMEDMVALNERGDSGGFWSDIVSIWNSYGSQFIRGAINTMMIALVSTIIGFGIGLLIAIFRSIKVNKKANRLGYILHRIVDFFISVYIEIFRGTPMMVQAMLIFFGSKLFFNIDMSSNFAAYLIVSINTAAYLAEVIRGGITGVDQGQYEGAKAIGMNHTQTMTSVVLPQAIRSTLPALGNEFVINIKDTSVLNVIAVSELFFVTSSAAGSTYMTFQSFFIASVIYLVLTFTTTRVLRLIERKMSGSDSYTVHESSTAPKASGGV